MIRLAGKVVAMIGACPWKGQGKVQPGLGATPEPVDPPQESVSGLVDGSVGGCGCAGADFVAVIRLR